MELVEHQRWVVIEGWQGSRRVGCVLCIAEEHCPSGSECLVKCCFGDICGRDKSPNIVDYSRPHCAQHYQYTPHPIQSQVAALVSSPGVSSGAPTASCAANSMRSARGDRAVAQQK